MADTTISDAARNAAVSGITDLLDAGAAAGYVEIRDGTKPAGPGTAASGTLLVTLTLSDPSFGAPTGGVGTANAISDGTAVASSTATWFRAYDSNANAVIDGDVSTTTDGTGDMQLDDTAIVTDGTVSVSSWTLTMPAT